MPVKVNGGTFEAWLNGVDVGSGSFGAVTLKEKSTGLLLHLKETGNSLLSSLPQHCDNLLIRSSCE